VHKLGADHGNCSLVLQNQERRQQLLEPQSSVPSALRASSQHTAAADPGSMLRVIVAGVVVFVLAAVGFVAHHERSKPRVPRAPAADEQEAIVTIATGERVVVDACVASRGLTVVEFTAEW